MDIKVVPMEKQGIMKMALSKEKPSWWTQKLRI
jgi:hypothetical protein